MNAATGSAANARRWYREPLIWLVLALPAASVAATIVLVMLADGDHVTDAAPEAVQRSAQVQQRDLSADRRALELGLVASARRVVDPQRGAELRIDASALPTGELLLEIVHPLQASADRRERLRHDGGELVVAAPDAGVAWRLRLSAASGEWRIVGRCDPATVDAAIALGPALGAIDVERR